uniref:Uncharacterized protein n=1 Tax=Triticum urartu TaxID=4572 RepID=A0A8R7QAX3_TRIUA
MSPCSPMSVTGSVDGSSAYEPPPRASARGSPGCSTTSGTTSTCGTYPSPSPPTSGLESRSVGSDITSGRGRNSPGFWFMDSGSISRLTAAEGAYSSRPSARPAMSRQAMATAATTAGNS